MDFGTWDLLASVDEKFYESCDAFLNAAVEFLTFKLLRWIHFSQKKQVSITWLEEWHPPTSRLKSSAIVRYKLLHLDLATFYITFFQCVASTLQTTEKTTTAVMLLVIRFFLPLAYLMKYYLILTIYETLAFCYENNYSL